MSRLAGKVALVTGGRSGIGQAIARAFHATGAKLVLTGRRAEPLHALAAETGARVLVADLAERAAVAQLCQEAGAIDVLVANAALPASGSLLDFSAEEIDRALDVNLRAPLLMARLLGEPMASRGRGHIVFISSVAGMLASAHTALYSAAKYGLRGAAQGLRKDLAKRGVGVTTVFPGFIREAGMFADTGVTLPRGMGTRSPQQVAQAVIAGVTRNAPELIVASTEQRVAGWLGSISPGLVAAVERLLNSDTLGDAVTQRQRHKR
jgi:short-subunit dehydrogenase